MVLQGGDEPVFVRGHRRSGLFDVEIEQHPARRLEHLRKRRDAKAWVRGRKASQTVVARRTIASGPLALDEVVGGVEGLQLGEAHGGDRPVAVGGPIHGGVVADDELAVRAGVHVELDGVGIIGERSVDRVARTRGRLASAALVGIGEHPPLEPRIVRHD